MTRAALLAAALGVGGAGCDPLGIACTEEAVPAVTVEVRDGATDAPVACRAVLVVRDGAFVEAVRADGLPPADPTDPCRSWPDAPAISAAYERPGTYDVRVEAPGYRPWERSGVRAEPGVCHVQTARLTARLRRAG